MLVSPVLGSVLATALLLLSSSPIDAAKTPAFMMDKKLRTSSTNTKHQQRLLANLMAKAQPRRHLDQANDDQAAQEEEEEWDDFGFEVDQYSVKYTGCSAIKTYSDEQAEDGNVIQAKRFVVFRLCPSDTCNKYTTEGCSEDFGEYVLEMGDYLEVMAQYQEEKNANFCAYCEACAEAQMNGGNGNNGNADNGNDDQQRFLEEGDDAAAADGDDAAAADGDDAVVAEEEVEGDECYNTCAESYNAICNEQNNNQNNGDDDAQEAEEEVDIMQFMECVGIENENNGNQYFLGPHCGSDDFTITVGLYSDEDCTTYIGYDYDVYETTGIDLSEIDMSFFYPHDCYSCAENEYQWENNDGDNQDEDNVNEMCENLYMSSAKCNTNFDTVNENAYYSSQQLANEEQVCNFIDNILSGKYDEDGEIIIDAYQFDVSNWNSKDQYIKTWENAKADVTPVQIAFLVITILGCFILSIVACCLHGSLTRKGLQWRPRRGKWTNPTDISRQNSGIVMGRSRSGPNGPLV